MPIEEKQQTFKDIQEHYDQLFHEEPIRDEDRAYRWFAERLFKEKPGARAILDLACGAGYLLREISRIHHGGVILAGTDLSQKALELAKKECPQAFYTLAVGESLPYRENTFDALICLGSLEHFLNISDAVREMKRIVRPDGHFFILVPNMFWYKDVFSVILTGNRKTRNQIHERFASLGEWVELLEELGLKVIKTEKYNGIASSAWKQKIKDGLIPLRLSYHFLFICKNGASQQ